MKSTFLVIAVTLCSFNSEAQTKTKEFSNLNRKKKIIGTWPYGDKSLTLTTIKPTSILKLYLTDGSGAREEKTYDLSRYRFGDEYKELYYSIISNRWKEKPDLTFIAENTFNLRDSTQSRRKIYLIKDKIILTFNYHDQTTKLSTRLIELNIETGKYAIKYVSTPALGCSEVINNSLIFENKIFQVAVCKDEMGLTIHDLESGGLLKEYKVSKSDSVYFKSTPFKQKGDRFSPKSEKKFEGSKKFFNMISERGTIVGLSVNNLSSDRLEIEIGGIKMLQTGSTGLLLTRDISFTSILNKSSLNYERPESKN